MQVSRRSRLTALVGIGFLLAGCGSTAGASSTSHHASHHQTKKVSVQKKAPKQSPASSGASGPFVASQDAAAKTVTLSVVAGATIDNFYYNFNGYDQGNATITVPAGWTVKIDFSNESGSAHSVVVSPSITDLTPVFPGATSPDLSTGIQAGQTQTFQFVAQTAGSYVLACGISGQASQDGMWVKFIVSSTATQASSQKG